MTQYIDKLALVSELKRRIQESIDAGGATRGVYLSERMKEDSYILSFIDTLEAKEVDLEKEIDNYFSTSVRKNLLSNDNATLFMQCRKVAKHFFELGLKAQKGE